MPELKCPVCRARFRGTVECSRCGADLAPLMRLVARSWKLRMEALEALRTGYVFLAESRAAESVNAMSARENQALQAVVRAMSLFKIRLT